MTLTATLTTLEHFYDAVPRTAGRAEDFGPLTLFVQEDGGYPLYARPALGRAGREPTAADVDRVRARQRDLGIPESFEWVEQTTPSLRAAAEASGLTVHAHPLMVLDASVPGPERPSAQKAAVRILGPGDPHLPAAAVLPHLAFAAPGTAVGPAGPAELAATLATGAHDRLVRQVADRVRAGRTVLAAAVEDGVVLCSGQYVSAGPVAEIVGVGTLPSARRRGLGPAVTSCLAEAARSAGISTVFLSASDENVARLYARLGFRETATALIAEPPA
ncbi:GNAT family N-acetyltransferase [Streptomyces sp. GC420]|uniref:GNAT family N-acetyltransferase n=1 Tax=Streptomyces sp. GC420 TaxID=2697568 RepID=UPI001414F115|nr:GNAT family N-acetyltransferase [Streptomyces sp. GC420]NBM18785.1 GNAT family N-acetyltransferase [Streptomyces sp. GC420]